MIFFSHYSFLQFFLITFFALKGLATTPNYDLTKYKINKINIRALNVNIELKSAPAGSRFLLSANSKDFKVLIKNQELEITDRRLNSLAVPSLDSVSPTFTIHILAPAVPIQLVGRQVNLDTSQWDQPIQASVISGKLNLVKISDLQLRMITGQVKLKDVKSKLDFFLGEASVAILQSEVSGRVRQQAGQLNLEKTKSESLKVTLFNVQSKWESVSGQIGLMQKEGQARWTDFSGELSAQTISGRLEVSFNPEAQIKVRSDKSLVVLKGPSQKNIKLNLKVEVGELSLPQGFLAQPESEGFTYQGLIAGEGQRSSATVRSQQGRIVFKFKE